MVTQSTTKNTGDTGTGYAFAAITNMLGKHSATVGTEMPPETTE